MSKREKAGTTEPATHPLHGAEDDTHAFALEDTIYPADLEAGLPDTKPTTRDDWSTLPPPSKSQEDLEELLPQKEDDVSKRLLLFNTLGTGGMGEVVRTYDKSLNRAIAMKVLHPHINQRGFLRARFLREAHITAQLAHPSIPPVHELGFLEDGRPFFTMKIVHGQTLAQLHKEIQSHPAAWSEQRRIEVFQKVCEAMAYAHSRGVIHCDLKPSNIMVGAFGEVMVMDWGLAQLFGLSRQEGVEHPEPPVRTLELSEDEADIFAGTPAYMSPEHAAYGMKSLRPATDVYALGLILYELLTGELPQLGSSSERLMKIDEPFRLPLPTQPGLLHDEALVAILTNALAPHLDHRYSDAQELSEDLASWREGALRREKALVFVQQAKSTLPMVEATQEQAKALHESAAAMLGKLATDADNEEKLPAWEREDKAIELEHEAVMRMEQVIQWLQVALGHDSELREARELLAKIHYERHRSAEKLRAWDEAELHEIALRAYDVGAYSGYLRREAPLSIATEPPCSIRVKQYVRRGRRLSLEERPSLGLSPLVEQPLALGSYLLELQSPSGTQVLYPVQIKRERGWQSAHPQRPEPIQLRSAAGLPPTQLFIPGSVAMTGGDPLAAGAQEARERWVDDFIILRYPVSFREFSAFLASPEGAEHRLHAMRDGLGLWRPEWPAVGVSWNAARDYAQWFGARTGLPWRLPTEWEWEKAARGVDGRFFPWGDFAETSYSHIRTHEHPPEAPVSITQFPTDASPYGMRGAGGNVREWCADIFFQHKAPSALHSISQATELRVARGGSWRLPLAAARCAARAALPAATGAPDVGFRLARYP